MTRKSALRSLIVRPEAEADIDDAAAYYAEREVSLALRFVDEVDRVMSVIRAHPRQFPLFDEPARRALLHRFPFGVYFEAFDDRVVVLAVLHLRRHPEEWKDR